MFKKTYILMLGEFDGVITGDSSVYENTFESYVFFITFVMATFTVEIVMMNLLITIMGDTFNQNQDKYYQL